MKHLYKSSMQKSEPRKYSWSILVPRTHNYTVFFERCSADFIENWLSVHCHRQVFDRNDADIIISQEQEVRFIRCGNGNINLDSHAPASKSNVYALLPPKNPRLVLPLNNRAQLLRGLSMHKPGRPSARIIMLFLRCFAAIGITAPIARRKLIVHFAPPANLDIDPASILYLGTEDPDRKTTILSPKLDEISKYGKGEFAQAALVQEANTLTALHDTVVASQVPKLLSFGPMGNGQLLRQEYRAPRRATKNWLEAEAARFLMKLSEINRETRDGIPGHLCHGDFAPWNMIRSQGGLFVFDWERGRDWAPALTDAFYFILAPALHVQRPDRLAEAASNALQFGRQVARATAVDEHMTPILWQIWANSESNFSSRETFERVRNLKVTNGE